jgi:hypothetical protein
MYCLTYISRVMLKHREMLHSTWTDRLYGGLMVRLYAVISQLVLVHFCQKFYLQTKDNRNTAMFVRDPEKYKII